MIHNAFWRKGKIMKKVNIMKKMSEMTFLDYEEDIVLLKEEIGQKMDNGENYQNLILRLINLEESLKKRKRGIQCGGPKQSSTMRAKVKTQAQIEWAKKKITCPNCGNKKSETGVVCLRCKKKEYAAQSAASALVAKEKIKEKREILKKAKEEGWTTTLKIRSQDLMDRGYASAGAPNTGKRR